jgi:hypothetical protein
MRKLKLDMAARMRLEFRTLEEIDAWRWAVEKSLVDAHLGELEAQAAEDIARQLRALDPLWGLA